MVWDGQFIANLQLASEAWLGRQPTVVDGVPNVGRDYFRYLRPSEFRSTAQDYYSTRTQPYSTRN